MSVQDMIKAIINKDASAFETAFTETMGARVSAAVQDHFGLTTEEVELDEISQES
jgi:adenylosuccinate lyase